MCPFWRVKHDKNHNIINYNIKDYICFEHNEAYKYYCSECKKNICSKCEPTHESHNISTFKSHNKGQLLDEIDNFNIDIYNLDKSIIEIIEKFPYFKYKINLYKGLFKDMINNYENENLNYQVTQNIKEILDFKKCISNDILTIINESDINKKVKYIINLYYKMNNIYEEDYSYEIISYKFLRQPQNLKYKLNIIEINDFKGVNDLFEIFVCNNAHKEYVASKNITNNRIYYDEYLISADINRIVIFWDIINDYEIKYQIDTIYNISSDKGLVIYSCLLIFDKNDKDNYIITSINNISEDIKKSDTKTYSLNNGNLIKVLMRVIK